MAYVQGMALDQGNLYEKEYAHSQITPLFSINYQHDKKIINFATVVVKNEDHTLGNVVRM